MKIYETIVIGGGPSGISCAYHLKQNNIEHLIIERREMLHTWRNERWDSFHLVTPNWMTNLPGMDHLIPYDNAFMSKQEIEHVLMEYMRHVEPHYVEHTRIDSVEKNEDYYVIHTNNGPYYAKHIIVAVGMFNKPFVPSLSHRIPDDILQIHSRDYMNPAQLKPGATLVVGSGRSGIQIALEVKKALGTETFLSVGSLTPLPAIYKNINGVYWLNKLSGFKEGKTHLPYQEADLSNQNIVDKISQNLYHCQISGVEILGRLVNVIDGQLEFSSDLSKVLKDGETYLKKLEEKINQLIDAEQMSVHHEEVPFDLGTLDYDILAPLTIVSLKDVNIRNIIWCTGFKPNYSWLTLDIFKEDGSLDLMDGIESKENVYFCGMGLEPDQSTKSSFGVGLYALNESAKRAVEAVIKRM